MANERTLLAWLRTAVALMGFGFVLAKFGYLFARGAYVHGVGFERAGTAVALGGGVVAVLSSVRFISNHRAIVRRTQAPAIVLPVAVALGVILLDAYVSWLLMGGGVRIP